MRDKCRYHEKCAAPFCPQDKQSLSDGSWFPDEEICRKAKPDLFIKNQRRIAKVTNEDFHAGYFTYAMLDRKFRICPGLRGLNPDKPLEQEKLELEKWYESHPIIQVTEEQRERGRKLANLMRSKNGVSDPEKNIGVYGVL